MLENGGFMAGLVIASHSSKSNSKMITKYATPQLLSKESLASSPHISTMLALPQIQGHG
jgi:hypothetical protein